MIFNSAVFAVFLPTVLLLYWILPRQSARLPLLLVASYVFYGAWDWRFLSLIAISTMVDYSVGRALEGTEDERTRRLLLVASLASNLGILAIFKYYDFFVTSFASLVGGFGLGANPPLLRVLLPVGISFYTFQTLSYTIDVFRRRMPAERSLLTFAVFVAYFPQLVAGPIERAKRLLPQLRSEPQPPSRYQLQTALTLILTGLFMKIVLADGIAPLVDARFSSPDDHGALSLLIGGYAFAIQIYGDFAGYSSIARGTSRLFGIELMRNFEQPYLSTSITQFWRTWHISLSSWLHDYLYVPLGGNRGGRWPTYRNLMLTMLLGGLWHGAAWTFVIWGALHGIFLSVHRALGAYEPRGRPHAPRLTDAWRVLGTFHLVVFAWVFFRADSLSDARAYLQGFTRLTQVGAVGTLELAGDIVKVALFGIIMLSMDLVDRRRVEIQPLRTYSPARLGVATAAMVAGLLVFSGGVTAPFIYFQF